jgi:hypothetical protein
VACVSSYGPVKFSVYPSDRVSEIAILSGRMMIKGIYNAAWALKNGRNLAASTF